MAKSKAVFQRGKWYWIRYSAHGHALGPHCPMPVTNCDHHPNTALVVEYVGTDETGMNMLAMHASQLAEYVAGECVVGHGGDTTRQV